MRASRSQADGGSFASANFQPFRVCTIDLDRPIETLTAIAPGTSRRYGGARVLVRLHGQPLGLVDMDIEGDLPPRAVADLVWRGLGEAINDHLTADGLPPVGSLGADGLRPQQTPVCMKDRESLRRAAPFASVVVCTRDRADSLKTTLTSLSELNYPNFEIILVDNAPRTGAARELFNALFGDTPNRTYVCEPRPGVSNARNCGLAQAKGEIIAYADDDARVDPSWLAELVQALVADVHIACVTGLSVAAELETPSQFWFDQGGGFNKGFSRRVLDLDEHRPPDPLFPYAGGTYGSGLNMSFRAEHLREIGGFDPVLGAGSLARGGEDLDVFVRLILKGFRIVYEPRAVVYHTHRRDFKALKHQMAGYGVGLTAMLTRWAVSDPAWLVRVIPKVPAALVHMLGAGSTKNRAKHADYPTELTLAEWAGMLYGPIAYFRSSWNMLRYRAAASQRDDGQNESGSPR